MAVHGDLVFFFSTPVAVYYLFNDLTQVRKEVSMMGRNSVTMSESNLTSFVIYEFGV